MLNTMEIIILAGGFGTRMKSISDNIPKSLLPIGDCTFFDIILENIFKQSIKHVYLSLHYKSEIFTRYLNRCKYKDSITPVIEPNPLGTGGAIKYVVENTNISENFFVINGDTLSNIKLIDLYSNFMGSGFKIMIGLSFLKDVTRYGKIKLKGNIIKNFTEKGVSGSGWINNGHYIMNREIFKDCNKIFSLEKEFFSELIVNEKLGSFCIENDTFIDIGIPDDYIKLRDSYR